MKKLYLVMHQLAGNRYHYALQDEVGTPLAETMDFSTAEGCRAVRDELIEILKGCAAGTGKPKLYQCGKYYYHAIKAGSEILLRTKTSPTLEDSKALWDQLVQCVRGEIIDYEYLRGDVRKILNIDPGIMSYMYSLDGMGQVNFLNYTAEVPWEHKDSWLYDEQTQQMSQLYRRLFHRMPRFHSQEYEIMVRTGIWEGAGTAGDIFLTIYGIQFTGHQTQTEEIRLTRGHPLRPGSILVRRHTAENLGLLQKIRIRYENPGNRADSRQWFLEDIQIRETGSRLVHYFPVNRWVVDSKGSQNQDFTVEGKFLVPDRYEVTIKTAAAFEAGQDSGVELTFFGGRKKTKCYSLGCANSYHKGGTGKFILHVSEKLDSIEKLQVAISSKCHLQELTIRNTTKNRSWNFPADLWFHDPENGDTGTAVLVAGPGPGEAAAYAVRIKTGDRMNAGTDADVYLTLHGTLGSSQEFELQGAENDFERNKLGIYRVATPKELGELTSITIRHNNYWPLAGWFLDSVEIEDVVRRKNREFPCFRWLARDEDGGVIQRNLEAVPEGCKAVPYAIRVRTGDFDGAATMARVFITLNGTLGTSGEYEFVDMREAFKEGGKGTLLLVQARDLGEITSITVRHDNSWLNPEWYLKDIRIVNQNDERVWYFPHEGWIGKEPDDLNERTLYPIAGRDDALPYRLRVRTGDASFAGTDAKVYVTINGSENSTQEIELKKKFRTEDTKNMFERNCTDEFRIDWAKELGEVNTIHVRHDNALAEAGWFLWDMKLTLDGTDKVWYFPCEAWLDKEQVNGVTERTLTMAPGRTDELIYRVYVSTGYSEDSGTDAKVFLSLEGTLGFTPEHLLNNSENNFKAGQVDEFPVRRTKELGELTQVRIMHDNSGLNPSWYLKDIKVALDGSDKLWYFPCDQWLDKKEGGVSDLFLPVAKARNEQMYYQIDVCTGEMGFSGTDANVYITLNGVFGSTDEHKLDSSGNDFEKGRTDIFTITQARDVGELLSLRIRHDNFGLFPGWYLKYIRVTRVNDEKAWYFPCEQWLQKEDHGCIDLTLTPGREPDPEKKGGENA
jgi:hypothetical protein